MRKVLLWLMLAPSLTFGSGIYNPGSTTIISGGSGSSDSFVLQVTTNGVQITSPTTSLNFLSPIKALAIGTTAQFSLDPSSVTLQGNAITFSGLQTQITATGVSTGSVLSALQTEVGLVATSTASLQTQITTTGVSTGSILSALQTEIGLVATSTASLQTQITATGVSTGSLQTQVTATGVSTGSILSALQTEVGLVATSTASLQTQITATGVSTGSLQTQVTTTGVSTGSILSALQTEVGLVATSTASLQTQITATGLSTGSILSALQVEVSAVNTSTTSIQAQVTATTVSLSTMAVLASTQTWTGGNTYKSTSTFQGVIAISSGLLASGSVGSSGQALTSGGPDTTPTWSTITGAAASGDSLGSHIATMTVTANYGIAATSATWSNRSTYNSVVFMASQTITNGVNYQATIRDSIILGSATYGGNNIFLPDAGATNSGQVISITKVNLSSSPIIIQVFPNSGDLIGGATGALRLDAYGQSDTLMATSADLWIPYGAGIQQTPNYFGAWMGNGTNTVGTSSIAICESFYTSVPVFIDSMTMQVSIVAATSKTDMGIYDNNGVRLTSNGGTTGPGTLGHYTLPMNPTINIGPGIYWLCMTNGGTTASFNGTTAVTEQYVGTISCAGANDPLPTTLAFPCTNTGRLTEYNIWAHIAGGHSFSR